VAEPLLKAKIRSAFAMTSQGRLLGCHQHRVQHHADGDHYSNATNGDLGFGDPRCKVLIFMHDARNPDRYKQQP